MKKQAFGRGRGLQSKALRNRKRRKLIFIVLVLIAVPSLAVAGLSYASYLDFMQIKNVTVNGNATIDGAGIVALAQAELAKPIAYIFSRSTIATYPKEEILSLVASSSPRIKAAYVSTHGLNTLGVTIVERMPQAVWCSDADACSYVDDSGLIYEATTSDSKKVFFPLYGQVDNGRVPYLSNALEFKKGLAALNLQATSIRIMPEYDADVTLSSGLVLKIALSDDAMDRLEAIRTLLSDGTFKSRFVGNKLAYIDLRFGNKIYYKASK